MRDVSDKSRAAVQQRRRLRQSAVKHLQDFLFHVVDKNVLGIMNMDDLPEVHRLQFLSRAVKRSQCSDALVPALLMLDCAVRCPEFTLKVAGIVRRASGRQSAGHITTAALCLQKRKYLPKYWSKRALCNLRKGLPRWNGESLLAAGDAWLKAAVTQTIDGPLDAVQTLPGVGSYLGHCMVRLMGAALDIRFTRGASNSADMSSHVGLMHELCDFRTMRGALLRRKKNVARSWSWAMLSCLYCEGAKILRECSVLREMSEYEHNRTAFCVDLAGPAMRAVLKKLSEAGVLPNGLPSEEAQAVASTLGLSAEMRSVSAVKRFRTLCPRA